MTALVEVPDSPQHGNSPQREQRFQHLLAHIGAAGAEAASQQQQPQQQQQLEQEQQQQQRAPMPAHARGSTGPGGVLAALLQHSPSYAPSSSQATQGGAATWRGRGGRGRGSVLYTDPGELTRRRGKRAPDAQRATAQHVSKQPRQGPAAPQQHTPVGESECGGL